MDKLSRREVYFGAYRVEWSDQKIVLDCICGEKEVEVFSDQFSYCPECSRRFSIQEIIKMEEPTKGEQ